MYYYRGDSNLSGLMAHATPDRRLCRTVIFSIYNSRLSNGPIESLNRKVKDLKRLGRGFRNFEHFRNRFLYATRNNPVLNGTSDQTPIFYFDEEE